VEQTKNGSTGYTEAWIPIADNVDHQELCDREQAFLAKAIQSDIDLTKHHEDALRSLNIVLAAERSMREKQAIDI